MFAFKRLWTPLAALLRDVAGYFDRAATSVLGRMTEALHLAGYNSADTIPWARGKIRSASPRLSRLTIREPETLWLVGPASSERVVIGPSLSHQRLTLPGQSEQCHPVVEPIFK